MQELADEYAWWVASDDEGGGSFEDAFTDWILNHTGIDEVSGDHNLCLRLYALVLMMFHDNPDKFGQNREYPFECCQSNPEVLPAFFELDYWNMLVFRRKYGHRIELPKRLKTT